MIDPKRIEDFIKKCCDAMPTNVTSIKKELAHNLQLFLQSTFDELNIVTREEFDVQLAILHRTQAKLKSLEAQLEQLEKKHLKNV
ncbi:MAG: accessory factor UbiK family protein [Gammaproteobacteria bacterium]